MTVGRDGQRELSKGKAEECGKREPNNDGGREVCRKGMGREYDSREGWAEGTEQRESREGSAEFLENYLGRVGVNHSGNVYPAKI